MKLSKSDKIALAALFVACLSLLVSIIFSVLSQYSQFGEDLLVEALPEKDTKIHVYAVSRAPNSPPQVTQLAFWCRIRVTNQSNKAISIIEASYREDDRLRIPVDQPLYKRVHYAGNEVKLGQPLELPIRLESSETRVFYALLPMSVPEKLGKSLVHLMRGNDVRMDTSIEIILFDPNYFSRMETELLRSLKDSKTAAIVDYQEVKLSEARVRRNLLRRDDNGGVTFYDVNNAAPDGFRFLESLILHNKVVANMIDSKNMTIEDLRLNFSTYTLVLQTGNGNLFKDTLKSARSPFAELKK